MFGVAIGAAANQKGLTFFQAVGQSVFVYAGASQMLTLQIWPQEWTLSALLAAVGVTAAINSLPADGRDAAAVDRRHGRAHRLSEPVLFMTDASFAIGASLRRRRARLRHGDRSHVPLYLSWVGTTALGVVAGALIARPERYGLDLVLPIVFTTVLVPMMRRASRAAPFVIAALVASSSCCLRRAGSSSPGALAGALSAALIDEAA